MRCPALLLLVLTCALTASAQTNGPVLISQANSTRAIAFDSPSFLTEPFALNSPTPWTNDPRTRVMLFVLNLALAPGEDLSAVTADAEDGQHHVFSLKVEKLGWSPGLGRLNAIVLRLNDNQSESGDVLVRVTYHGVSSNRVRIGIGHVGGGLPDDPGSAPTPAPAPEPTYVLEYDGTPKTVDCGFFWPGEIPLGHFFWEVWAEPGVNAGGTYMISDGYGGAHALLFGFGNYSESEADRYELFGDIWDGSTWTFFSSDEGPAVGEWGHVAVGWDGRQIITYFNGVPVGRVPFTGPRISPGSVGGGGRLLIGGSDHNNLIGRIAQVRGYEDRNPREDSSVTAAFAPEAVFSRGGNYLSYFFRPSQTIADLSADGYQGKAHPGLLRGTPYPYGLLTLCPDCPLPQFVIDQTAPNFLNSPTINTSAPVAAAPSTPANALIFDSFSRANSTYALGTGGLGSTESGSAGQKLWQTSPPSTGQQPFGILNGRAVLLANEMALAWVPTGSANGNLDIQVNRHVGIWGSGFDTGIAFRVSDSRNFFFAYTSGNDDDPPNARKLTVGYYLNGARTDLVTNLIVRAGWTTLEVVSKSSGQITVATDRGGVYSVNSSILANATGAGLYNNGPGLGLLNRWDDFTVYNVP